MPIIYETDFYCMIRTYLHIYELQSICFDFTLYFNDFATCLVLFAEKNYRVALPCNRYRDMILSRNETFKMEASHDSDSLDRGDHRKWPSRYGWHIAHIARAERRTAAHRVDAADANILTFQSIHLTRPPKRGSVVLK